MFEYETLNHLRVYIYTVKAYSISTSYLTEKFDPNSGFIILQIGQSYIAWNEIAFWLIFQRISRLWLNSLIIKASQNVCLVALAPNCQAWSEAS